jgi:hypothetical protein
MNQFGESQISGTEFFFRVADRLQMDSCLTAVSKQGKSLVLVSPSGELLDHFGAAFIRRLKQNLGSTPVEVFMPPDSEVMLERFNKLLSSLSLDVATQTRKELPPESVWVVHDANALGSYEIELLTRLVHQFPGAGISTVLMFTSDANRATAICNQGQQFVSWVFEMPTPEQKLSAIQQARKNGNEDSAVKFFNRLSRDAAAQVGKASKEKSETKDPKPTDKKSTETAKSVIKKPINNRKLWPWVLVVSGLLAISVGVAAMLHPEAVKQFATDLNMLFDSNTYEPKVKPKAKIELPAEKPTQATGGPTIVQGELPVPVVVAPTPTPAVLDPVPPTPAPPPPAPLSVAKEPFAVLKPEKVITELPEGAVQGRLWLKGLPDDSYVLQHGTFASLKQARTAMKDKEWLVNARVLPVFRDGKDEAEFALVTGPFRTKDRAQNTIARLKLSGSVSLESSANLYKQSIAPKSKP